MSCIEKEVAIVVGHTQDSKGACSPHGIPCEWDFNSVVASHLTDVADIYHYDTYKGGYTNMVKRLAAKINKKNYKIVIELHYNAASPTANGCETLYYFASKKGKEYAQLFTAQIVGDFRVTSRGIKALVNSNDRGFAAVYYTKAPTIMAEPFFGSNFNNASKFKGREKEYANSIREFIKKIK